MTKAFFSQLLILSSWVMTITSVGASAGAPAQPKPQVLTNDSFGNDDRTNELNDLINGIPSQKNSKTNSDKHFFEPTKFLGTPALGFLPYHLTDDYVVCGLVLNFTIPPTRHGHNKNGYKYARFSALLYQIDKSDKVIPVRVLAIYPINEMLTVSRTASNQLSGSVQGGYAFVSGSVSDTVSKAETYNLDLPQVVGSSDNVGNVSWTYYPEKSQPLIMGAKNALVLVALPKSAISENVLAGYQKIHTQRRVQTLEALSLATLSEKLLEAGKALQPKGKLNSISRYSQALKIVGTNPTVSNLDEANSKLEEVSKNFPSGISMAFDNLLSDIQTRASNLGDSIRAASALPGGSTPHPVADSLIAAPNALYSDPDAEARTPPEMEGNLVIQARMEFLLNDKEPTQLYDSDRIPLGHAIPFQNVVAMHAIDMRADIINKLVQCFMPLPTQFSVGGSAGDDDNSSQSGNTEPKADEKTAAPLKRRVQRTVAH